jgi:hypothetical protein
MQVFTAVKIWVVIFWIVVPFGAVGVHKLFGETQCLYLQGRSHESGPIC